MSDFKFTPSVGNLHVTLPEGTIAKWFQLFSICDFTLSSNVSATKFIFSDCLILNSVSNIDNEGRQNSKAYIRINVGRTSVEYYLVILNKFIPLDPKLDNLDIAVISMVELFKWVVSSRKLNINALKDPGNQMLDHLTKAYYQNNKDKVASKIKTYTKSNTVNDICDRDFVYSFSFPDGSVLLGR